MTTLREVLTRVRHRHGGRFNHPSRNCLAVDVRRSCDQAATIASRMSGDRVSGVCRPTSCATFVSIESNPNIIFIILPQDSFGPSMQYIFCMPIGWNQPNRDSRSRPAVAILSLRLEAAYVRDRCPSVIVGSIRVALGWKLPCTEITYCSSHFILRWTTQKDTRGDRNVCTPAVNLARCVPLQ